VIICCHAEKLTIGYAEATQMAGRGNRAQGKQEATVVFFHSYEGQNKVRGDAMLRAMDN
jgi:late competence protein required for DNA uptake (superfamily II DNA/RNA helicase)